MDDLQPKASQKPDDPLPVEMPAAPPSPFGLTPMEAGPVDSSPTVPPGVEHSSIEPPPLELSPEAEEPVTEPPQYELAGPPADALPGDAAPTPIVPVKPVNLARPGLSDSTIEPVGAVAPPPRTGSFTLWMLIWVVAWGGIMALTLRCAVNRQYDHSTSMYATAARNLLQSGMWPIHGGVYVVAGNVHDHFYFGRPPLTAWILAGWMKLLGNSDFIIRALPLAFSALNLLLLYMLVRRVFGAPAALATAVICSLLPMTAYYARVVSPEPFELTFLLGAAVGYLEWAKSGCKFGFVLLCVCVILGCWTDWLMYAFTGLLAVTHFFRRRDLLASELVEGEDQRPGRPLISSLFLIVLPMGMFALFLVYLKLNSAGFGQLKGRAVEHVAEQDGASARVWFTCGYQELFNTLRHPQALRVWLLDLFTAPALLLALLGLIFWTKWSRRLSLASGEAARRAAFRIVFCLIVMQLLYTLAFPHAAQTRETWQYYLIAPVAMLSACVCAWLTLAGGTGRRFSSGLMDRIAWSVAALIPLLAIEPFLERVHGSVPAMPASTQVSTRPAGGTAVILPLTTRPAATSSTTKPAP